MNARSRKGLSLVELMVTVAITVIIGGILARFLIIGGAAWHSGDAEIQATQEARKGMVSMARELRQSTSGTLTDMSGALFDTQANLNRNFTSIVFKIPTVVAGNNNYGAYGTAVANSGAPNWSTPDRKSTRLNSSHRSLSRMPSSA